MVWTRPDIAEFPDMHITPKVRALRTRECRDDQALSACISFRPERPRLGQGRDAAVVVSERLAQHVFRMLAE